MNPIAKYLIAIGLFAGYSFATFQFGAMHQREKDALANATATVTQTQGARKEEHVMNKTVWDIDAAYQKGVLEGRKNAQTLTDSLLSGASGMYVPNPPTPAVSGATTTVTRVVTETRCELPAQTAVDLTRLAEEADDRVRQANSLVDYYEDVIRRLGHPELIRKP